MRYMQVQTPAHGDLRVLDPLGSYLRLRCECIKLNSLDPSGLPGKVLLSISCPYSSSRSLLSLAFDSLSPIYCLYRIAVCVVPVSCRVEL